MRDFPIFTTEFGVASLVLKEIPYKKLAYIRIRDVQPGHLAAHLAECVSFCRMAGAEEIFAEGHGELEAYPLHCAVLDYRGEAGDDPDPAALFPVTEQTVARWRHFYNEKMAGTDCAATLEGRDEKEILASGGAYFVHDNGRLLGIGWLEGEKLLALAAERGRGERTLRALMTLVSGDTVTLEVASTNGRARRLYERLGFAAVGEVRRWYRVG